MKRFQMGTAQVELPVRAADTKGQYVVAVLSFPGPESKGPELHVHEEHDETFVALEGEFDMTCAGESTRMGPGDVVHVPRNAPHIARAVGEGPNRLMIIAAPGDLEDFFLALGDFDYEAEPHERELDIWAKWKTFPR